MTGEVPGDFNALAPGRSQHHFVRVGQFQAGYSLSGLDFGNFAVGYETLEAVSKAQLERMPAFSMMVGKPEDGDPAVAERIRAAATGYTLPARDLAGLMEGEAEGEKKVSEYRRLLAERNGAEPRGEGQ